MSEQHRRKCLFCGAFGVSREHIFPRWMRNLVGDGNPLLNRHVRQLSRGRIDTATGATTSISLVTQEGQGAAQHRKLRVACRVCNREWMGRIEQRAREPMARLIQDEMTVLDPGQLAAIAAWAALKAIVNEFTQPETRCIPDACRAVMKQSEQPPPGFFISIGRLASPATLTANHQHASPEEVLDSSEPVPHSMQTTAFVMRHLLVYVATFDPDVFAYQPDMWHPELPLIWPPQEAASLSWSMLSPLSRPRSKEIAMATSRIGSHVPYWWRTSRRIRR